MRITYCYDMVLPTTATDSEQVLNTVAVLGRAGATVTLAVPETGVGEPDAEALSKHYQVACNFSVATFPRRFESWRSGAKVWHASQVARSRVAKDADLLYTRNLSGLRSLVRAGHRVVYEHFRPWPDQYPILQPWFRSLLLHDDFVGAVFHSNHAAESFRKIGLPDAKICVAHNGYDASRMEPRKTRAEARDALNLPTQKKVIGYVGRVNEKKGLDVMLEMARREPEHEFWLAGSEGEGPVELESKNLPNVRVLPWADPQTVALYLQAVDVLVVPPSVAPLQKYKNTVLPMKLFQYFAAGRPILAPRSPDTQELLTDGVNAGLVEPGNVDDALAFIRRVTTDEADWNRLAAGALESSKELTWEARGEKVFRFLEHNLTQQAGPSQTDAWSIARWAKQTLRWASGRT
jgi:starch synthase